MKDIYQNIVRFDQQLHPCVSCEDDVVYLIKLFQTEKINHE